METQRVGAVNTQLMIINSSTPAKYCWFVWRIPQLVAWASLIYSSKLNEDCKFQHHFKKQSKNEDTYQQNNMLLLLVWVAQAAQLIFNATHIHHDSYWCITHIHHDSYWRITHIHHDSYWCITHIHHDSYWCI